MTNLTPGTGTGPASVDSQVLLIISLSNSPASDLQLSSAVDGFATRLQRLSGRSESHSFQSCPYQTTQNRGCMIAVASGAGLTGWCRS